MGTRREELDRLNIEYTPIDTAKTEALQREYNGVPIAITLKGIYRLFHNGMPHYFVRLNDALDFWHFTRGQSVK